MATEQFNIRLTRRTLDIIRHNARGLEMTPSQYARSILEKEERLYTGIEIDQRINQIIRRRKAAAAQ